jgi:hypothetical protein
MKLRVLDEAEAELLEAVAYYEDCRPGLGCHFYDCVNEAMLAIGRDPLRFPLYEGKRRLRREFRRARVARFPYIVVFESREHETLVVAVAHTSRKPAYWEDRA